MPKLIVGLGNPGKEYTYTRHNLGFIFLDRFLASKNIKFTPKLDFRAEYIKISYLNETVIFMKPQTYMNLSGTAIKEIVAYYKIDINDILIIYDDLDIVVGEYKFKKHSSGGNHNGMKNITSELKTEDIARIRIGIGPKPESFTLTAFVLGNITDKESDLLVSIENKIFTMIDDFIAIGYDKAVSKKC